jgi:protein-disulfide isomerase
MDRRLVLGGIAAAIAGGGVIWKYSTGTSRLDPVSPASAESADVDSSQIVEMTMGPDDAKVTVIEYASFTCPHCANFHKGPFQKLKAEYIDTGKVRFIYRDVYFDRFGLMAAQIARCGGKERFFGIADMIYTQQREWIGSGDDPEQITQNLRKIGKVAGLSDAQLDACLTDKAKTEALVAWYNRNAKADNIRGTPSFIINGKPYSNMSYDKFKEAIEAALAG